MAIDNTNTEFIATVKRIATFPNSQNLLTDSDILKNATKEMRGTVVPLYLKNRDDFFVKYKDFTNIAGVTEFNIPERAIGQIVKDIQLVDSAGNIQRPPRIDTDSNTNSDFGYYFKANKIILCPGVSTDADVFLRMVYFTRPNEMVKTSECALITSINTLTNEVTCATVPTTWVVGTSIDFISSTPLWDTLQESTAITVIASTTITFSSLPADLVVGDYLAEAQTAPYAQIPLEGKELLAQLTALKCLENMGDEKGYGVAMARYQQMADDLVNLISPRAQAESKFVRNQGNAMRRRGYWWWY